MPSQDRVGGDEPGEVQQRLSADSLAGDGEPTPLVIGQPDPSVTELFEKDAVLLPQEVDRRLLVPIDPACECCEEERVAACRQTSQSQGVVIATSSPW